MARRANPSHAREPRLALRLRRIASTRSSGTASAPWRSSAERLAVQGRKLTDSSDRIRIPRPRALPGKAYSTGDHGPRRGGRPDFQRVLVRELTRRGSQIGRTVVYIAFDLLTATASRSSTPS
jgi:hypothetical protein